MTCDARIRMMRPINDVEVACQSESQFDDRPHVHRGPLTDYAYPGSVTKVAWEEEDRRTFHGEWPGECPGCILPVGHRGRHAQ